MLAHPFRPAALAALLALHAAHPRPLAAMGPSASTPARDAGIAVRCEALAADTPALPNRSTAIASARLNPAAPASGQAPAAPEHCELFGSMNERVGVGGQRYAIRFHLRLPSAWNGRFFFEGGGATNGNVGDALGNLQGRQTTNALALGYAVVSQDAGHDNAVNNDAEMGGTLTFAFDPQARLDFGYRSYDEVTRTAKALIRAYYGKAPDRSYYVGCSEGGREGMMMTQRFPDQYDGVLSVAPGFRLPRAGLGESWDLQALAALARARGLVDAHGRPLLNRTFTDRDLVLASRAVLAACDRLDGLEDGLIDNFPACRSEAVRPELAAIACRAGKTSDCLANDQIAALTRMFDGARNAKGERLYADWPWDAGIGDTSAHSTFEGWRRWKLGAYESNGNDAINATLGAAAMATLFATPPRRASSNGGGFLPFALGLDFDTDAATILETSAPYDESSWAFMMASATDLSRFTQRGGRLLIVHGVSDPVFSINDTLAWWADVNQAMNGRASTVARVFAVPGMAHCGTGPSTDQFDAFAALVRWVEAGTPPDRIVATARSTAPWPGRTRPLCPYPAQARYRGRGSIDTAESFECR